MDGYIFWQDLFDTLQSFPDWLTLIVVLIPPGFVLGLAKIISTHRLTRARILATAAMAAPPPHSPFSPSPWSPPPSLEQLEIYLRQELQNPEPMEQYVANLLAARPEDERDGGDEPGGDDERRPT